MEANSSKNNPHSSPKDLAANALSDWLLAITTFQTYYNQLSPYTNLEGLQASLPVSKDVDSGQCPIASVRELIGKMHAEVRELLQDLNSTQSPNQTYAEANYKKLARHTRRLNRLNQQAQILVALLSQSPT